MVERDLRHCHHGERIQVHGVADWTDNGAWAVAVDSVLRPMLPGGLLIFGK